MGTAEVFRLVGKFVFDNTEGNQGIEESANKAKSFSEKMAGGFKTVGENATKLGTKMSIGLTAPLTLIGKKAVDVAADFEYSMSEVGAISGATGEDLAALENKAKEMGETTKFSASDSAEALKYMAMAGWKTHDMLDGLEGIMNLAAASGEDLGVTSDIVTDALTAFGLKASDSGHFADVLAKASSNANTNVSMMGETFKYIAPVAGALGFSAEDTALAIGLMANSGIKASQAGTSLRGALTNLASPTDKMVDAMVDLGLATKNTTNVIDDGKLQKAQTKVENKTIDMEKAQIKYNEAVAKYGVNSSQAQTAALNLEKAQNNLEAAIYDLNVAQEGKIETTGIDNNLLVDSAGKTKSLREVMLTLRSAFAGLTEEEQTQAAATLFGKEAMSGMLAIINASDSDFDKLVSSIDSADGAAKEMADTMNDNLSGQITLLKSQIEGLMIQFVDLVMPYLKKGVEWLSKVCDWVAGLDENTQMMIITIGGILAAAGPVLIFFGNVAKGIGGIMDVGGKLAGGIGGLIGKVTGGSGLISALKAIPIPVWIVIGILTVLVAAGVAVYKNWDTVKEWAGKIWGAIKDVIGSVVDGIIGFFTGLGQALLDVGKSFIEVGSNIVKGLWEGITSAFTWVFDKIKSIFSKVIDLVKNLFGIHSPSTVFIEIGKNIIMGLVEGLVRFIQTAIDTVANIVGTIIDGFAKLKDGVAGKFNEMKSSVLEKAAELKDAVVGKVTELKDGAVQKFNELKDGAIEKAAELKDRTVEKYQELKERVHEKVTELKERTVEKFGELKEKVSAKANELKEKAVSTFSALKDGAVEKFGQLKEQATEKVNALKESAVSKINELKDKASDKINTLKEKGIAGFEALREKGLEKFDRLKSGVTEKLEAVKSFVSNTVQKLKDFFHFDWSLPKIKLPHFSMKGSFSLNPPSIPHIGVEWYKKAMDHPVLMEKPTAFGINSFGQIMAGGEAGSEVVSGTETLMEMISAAVAENNGRMQEILIQIYDILVQYLPGLADMRMVLDTGALVGAMSGKMNEELGWIKHTRGRWN